MNKKNLEKLLFESFDRSLNEKETSLLEAGLKNSKDLENLRLQIVNMRKLLGNSAPRNFNGFFETRVMQAISNQISRNPTTSSIANLLSLSFNKVIITATVILVILMTYNIGTGNSGLLDNLLGLSKTTIEYAFDPALQLISN